MTDREIFMGAPDGGRPEELASYLDRMCAGDGELRQRVDALFEADARAADGAWLQTEMAPGPVGNARGTEVPGDVVGNYKLLQQIGEGGFGVVYMAEQLAPVKRQVAFKIIKPGMDTRQVVARFEVERQALAMMDHPNIARVLDAGTTETGRPFFVMELIRGIPITKFCDEQRLPTPNRLGLFIDVCRAVQHAHQKGIIHRDLKPSNILVTLHDDKPVVKVIDFGVAKATQEELTDKTLFTRFEQLIGTPAYMSPEQAQFNGIDIDTRSDIYSLGVLLYELLTGRPPFDSKQLASAGYEEMRRVIREDEPQRPSTRVNSLGEKELTTLAMHRKSGLDRVRSELSGDLDWMVMKALEKDRTRRYETANALAMDVKRHLDHEPVAAGPPSSLYRFRKFARRRRGRLASIVAVAAVLLGGIVVSTRQAVRARAAEKVAEAERKQAEIDRQRAQVGEQMARRNLYAADMLLVQKAVAEKNYGRAQALLDRNVPDPGEEDFRGWEWRFLRQECAGDQFDEFASFSNPVMSVQFSTDDRRILAATGAGEVVLWDRETRERVVRFDAGKRCLWARLSPDGQLVVACVGKLKDDSGSVRVWNLRSGRLVLDQEFESYPRAADFSPDGRELAVLIPGLGLVQRWSVERFDLEKELTIPQWTGNAIHVGAIRYAPDGKHLAVGLNSGRVALFDTHEGVLEDTIDVIEHRVPGGWGSVMGLGFSPDGSTLAVALGYTAYPPALIDIRSRKVIRMLEGHGEWVSSASFSNDGKHLVTASADGTIRKWNTGTWETERIFRGHRNEILCSDFGSGEEFASGSKDGSLYLWDASLTRRTVGVMAKGVAGFEFIHSESVATLGTDGSIRLLFPGVRDDYSKVASLGSVQRGVTPNTIAVGHSRMAASPAKKMIAAIQQNGSINVYRVADDWQSAQKAWEFQGIEVLGFAADGDLLATLTSSDAIEVRSTKTWELTHRVAVQFEEPLTAAAISPDGRHFAMAGRWGRFSFGSVASPSERYSYQLIKDISKSCVFSHDSKMVAVGVAGGVALVCDTGTGSKIALLETHRAAVHAVSFSPGDRQFLVADSEGRMNLWNVVNWQQVLSISGAGRRLFDAGFSKNGSTLAALDAAGDLRFWRVLPDRSGK